MNFNNLGSQAAKGDSTSRAIVEDRVLQYDADFACYEVADLDQPPSVDFRHLLEHITVKRHQAGAAHVNVFITLGTKTGREAMATVKPYQENRDPDAPIKVRVRELRDMLANYVGEVCTPVHKPMYEADDLIVQYQHARIKEHGWYSSCVMSGDKDLWMAQGLHCNPKTGELVMVKGFGKTEYKDVGNVKPKLVGLGTSWFWHQMIMGDKADNIPGLEKISNKDLDMYFPLKSGKPRKDGAGACGEAKAYEVLKTVTTDEEAAKRTWVLYYNYYGPTAMERFFEQAYLLWMQRNYADPYDVIKYFEKSCKLKITPNKQQRAKLGEFEKCVLSYL
jgi:DNA polymerase-1